MVVIIDKERYYAYVISYKQVGLDKLSRLYIENPEGMIRELSRMGYPHVFIQTCNRIEFYTYGYEIEDILNELRDYTHLLKYMLVYKGMDVFRHLIRVLCGLESIAIGEHQISGQIRKWYNLARKYGAVSPELEFLFSECFKISRKIRSKLNLRQYIDYITVTTELIETDDVDGRNIAVIGTGATAEELLFKLTNHGVRGNIYVISRKYDRAKKLADKYMVNSIRFEEMWRILPDIDILITATSTSKYIIDMEFGSKLGRDTLIIDLGMPPNVNPEIRKLGVKLYTFRDLSDIIRKRVGEYDGDTTLINQLISQELSKLERRLDIKFIEEIINKIYKRAEEIRLDELYEAYSYIKNKDVISKKVFLSIIDKFSKSLIKKILHNYTSSLRKIFRKDLDDSVLEVIKWIFCDDEGV